MLKLAVPASLWIFVITLIAGCSRAEADASLTDRRACAVNATPTVVPVAPVAPVAETITEVPDPVVAPIVRRPIPEHRTGEVLTLAVSGFTSSESETDGDPCIAADTSDICRRKADGESICASNIFEFGTRIHVKGLGICVVADRMNSRYNDHVDWYFGQDATPPKGHEKDLKYLPKLHAAMKIDRNAPPRIVTVISR